MLMVRPSFEFIALTFGLMRAGIVVVLIDPGMGRSNIFRCLEEINPDGFLAIPIVQAIRVLKRRLFRNARFNVTVAGRKWFWGGKTYRELLTDSRSTDYCPRPTASTAPAAIIFTSGSTGPPKGVVYEHRMFDAQVDLLRDFYGIQPGESRSARLPVVRAVQRRHGSHDGHPGHESHAASCVSIPFAFWLTCETGT